MLDRTLAAVEQVDMSVLYATKVVPSDAETLQDAIAKASPNVILVEPCYEGAHVQNVARALLAIATRTEAIGVPHRILDRYGSPERHDLEYGLLEEGIRARITNFLNIGNPTYPIEPQGKG